MIYLEFLSNTDFRTILSVLGFILSLINFWFLFWRQRPKFDVKINEIVDSRVEFYIEFLFINKSDKPLSITGIIANSNNESFRVVNHVQDVMFSKYFDEPYKTNGLPIKLDPYQAFKCYIQFTKNKTDKDFDYDYLKFKFTTSRSSKSFCRSTKEDLIIQREDLHTK